MYVYAIYAGWYLYIPATCVRNGLCMCKSHIRKIVRIHICDMYARLSMYVYVYTHVRYVQGAIYICQRQVRAIVYMYVCVCKIVSIRVDVMHARWFVSIAVIRARWSLYASIVCICVYDVCKVVSQWFYGMCARGYVYACYIRKIVRIRVCVIYAFSPYMCMWYVQNGVSIHICVICAR